MYIVYILECADGTYYTGSTNNLERRIHAHNHTKHGARYTKMRRPVLLKYTEECVSYRVARTREGELKRLSRIEKSVLIQKKK